MADEASTPEPGGGPCRIRSTSHPMPAASEISASGVAIRAAKPITVGAASRKMPIRISTKPKIVLARSRGSGGGSGGT